MEEIEFVIASELTQLVQNAVPQLHAVVWCQTIDLVRFYRNKDI